jgi:hypothetical protein
MSALMLLLAAGCVIAATTGVLIRIRRERAEKRMRAEFKNVLKLQKELNGSNSADD